MNGSNDKATVGFLLGAGHEHDIGLHVTLYTAATVAGALEGYARADLKMPPDPWSPEMVCKAVPVVGALGGMYAAANHDSRWQLMFAEGGVMAAALAIATRAGYYIGYGIRIGEQVLPDIAHNM